MNPSPYFFIYDGRCGLCVAFKDWLMEKASPGLFESVAFDDGRMSGILAGKPAGEIRESAHVVTPAGQILSGHAAIVLALSVSWWGRILGPILSMPFLDQILRFTYTWISKNRYRLSCQMRARSE